MTALQAQEARLRRIAGALALEMQEAGKTPDGYTTAEHQEAIYRDCTLMAANAAAYGGMNHATATEFIGDGLEKKIRDMQTKGRS